MKVLALVKREYIEKALAVTESESGHAAPHSDARARSAFSPPGSKLRFLSDSENLDNHMLFVFPKPQSK